MLYKYYLYIVKLYGIIQIKKGALIIMANRIAELRIAKGISQKCLAEMIGVSQQFISSVERGGATPSLKLACKIKKLLEVSLDDLFICE